MSIHRTAVIGACGAILLAGWGVPARGQDLDISQAKTVTRNGAQQPVAASEGIIELQLPAGSKLAFGAAAAQPALPSYTVSKMTPGQQTPYTLTVILPDGRKITRTVTVEAGSVVRLAYRAPNVAPVAPPSPAAKAPPAKAAPRPNPAPATNPGTLRARPGKALNVVDFAPGVEELLKKSEELDAIMKANDRSKLGPFLVRYVELARDLELTGADLFPGDNKIVKRLRDERSYATQMFAHFNDLSKNLAYSRELYAEVVEIQIATYGKDSKEVANTRAKLADLDKRIGAPPPRQAGKLPAGLDPAKMFLKAEADMWFDTAFKAYNSGDLKEAIRAGQNELDVRTKLEGAESKEIMTSVMFLATIHYKARNYGAALPLFERWLALDAKHQGTDVKNRAMMLRHSGDCNLELSRLEPARKALTESLRLRSQLVAANSPDLADGEFLLGRLHKDLGNFPQAEGHMQRALNIYESQEKPDPNLVAIALNGLATIYDDMERFDKAEPLYLRSLKMQEERVGPQHDAVASCLNNLGWMSMRMGRYDAAEKYLLRSLAIREAVFKKDDPVVALTRTNLARLYFKQGRYAQAETLFQQALETHGTRGEAGMEGTAMVLGDLAVLRMRTGQYIESIKLFKECLALYEQKFGPEHAEVAVTLTRFGELCATVGVLDKADEAYRRALAIKTKQHGPDHPEVARCMNNVAVVCERRGDLVTAGDLFEKSRVMLEKGLGKDHPEVAACINNLAGVYERQGKAKPAEELYRQGLNIREARLGLEHPDVSESVGNLADFYAVQKDWPQAIALQDRSRRISRKHIARTLPMLSEEEQLDFLGNRDAGLLAAALSLALRRTGEPADCATTAGWVINGKAVAQQALAERAMLSRASGAEQALVEPWLAIRGQLAALAISGPTPQRPVASHIKLVEELTSREQAYAKRVAMAVGRPEAADPWVELAAVRAALPAKSVLVEFARFPTFELDVNAKSRFGEPRYAAWVIPPKDAGDVQLIDLGSATAIDAAVLEVRKSLEKAGGAEGDILNEGPAEAEKLLKEPLAKLAALVLRPLDKALGDSERWLLSPDGDLWLVPWCAMPLADGRYAIEQVRLSYLVSGRDLVRTPERPATGAPLIMADPDFDLNLGGKAAPAATRGALDVSFDWTRLPGTAQEADAIGPKLAAYCRKAPQVFRGDQAVERKFKQTVRPRIVVFSTHGFFVPDPSTSTAGGDASARSGDEVALDQLKITTNPLLRCGLVLAGANKRPAVAVGGDDGVLTGMEIVSVDLRGAELVALSACETGVGRVQGGEGVAGLRQAFQLAGAESVVASLWKVPDAETARLMTTFWDQIAAGKDRADALRSAQLAIIQSQRSGPDKAAHPYFWAAFTLTGEPGVTRAAAIADRPQPTSQEFFDRGVAAITAAKWDDAIAELTVAVQLDPKNALAYKERGRAYVVGKQDYERAMQDFTLSIEIDPKLASAHNNLGAVYRNRGDEARAFVQFDKAIALDPKLWQAYDNRAKIFVSRNELAKAAADFDQVIALNDNVSSRLERADVYRRLNQPDKAISDSNLILDKNPKAAQALAIRGAGYRLQNKADLALADYNAALELVPKYEFVLLERAELYFAAGKYDLTIVDASRRLDLPPRPSRAYVLRGVSHSRSGRYREAIADLNEALALTKNDAFALAERGEAHRMLGDYDSSIADLSAALTIVPRNARAKASRGACYAQKKQYPQALADLSEAIGLNPGYAFAHRNRGVVYVALGGRNEALADFSAAIQASPGWALPYSDRAELYEAGGDKANAEADRAKVRELTEAKK